MDDVTRQFQAGADDYWRGYIPDGWDDKAHREECAYHMGWYMASMGDLGNYDGVECGENA